MTRDQLLGLVADVDRLLAAGATAAVGHDGLSRRGRALRELGPKVAALQSVADAVGRVTNASPREVGRAFLDLVVIARQLRGSLAGAGMEGPLQAIESSDSWQTPMPARDVYNAHNALTADVSSAASSALQDAMEEREVTGDLRLLPSALAALESSKSTIADLAADKVLPAIGCGVLPDLLTKLDLKGNKPDARRLRVICKIDPSIGAELCRKGLSEGSPALKIQALECLPDVGEPGEAEKAGLEFCKEKKLDIRVAALYALRKATGDEALEVLIQALLSGDDWQIVHPAREVLRELPHRKATERLLHGVEQRFAALPPPAPKPKKGAKKGDVKPAEKATQARSEAVETLCRFIGVLGGRRDASSQRVLTILLDLARHADERIRLQAVQALAELSSEIKEVVPALTAAVGDADFEVSKAAVVVLSKLPREQRETATPAMIEWALEPLKRGEPPALFTAILVKTDPEGTISIPALIALLKHDKARVRSNALLGLIGYGPKAQAAEPLVTKLLKDRDWMVKHQAERVLAAIKGEE